MPDDFDDIERRFGGKAPAAPVADDFDAIEARFAVPGPNLAKQVITPTTVKDVRESIFGPTAEDMDLDTQRKILGRITGTTTSPGGVDLAYPDTDSPNYRRQIRVEMERYLPGARSKEHGAALLANLPEKPPEPEAATFGEKATVVAKRLAKGATTPPSFLASALLGEEGAAQLASEHTFAPGSGAGLSPEREAVARKALEASLGGRVALGAADLIPAIPGLKVYGGALKGAGPLAGPGALALHGGLEGGAEGFGGGAAFGIAAGGLSIPLQRWIQKLPEAVKGTVVQRFANAGAEGFSFAGADAILHGPDGERALEQAILGGALGFQKAVARTLPRPGEAVEVTAARGEARMAEAKVAEVAKAEAAVRPDAEPTPGEPVEVTLKRGENRLAAQAAPEARPADPRKMADDMNAAVGGKVEDLLSGSAILTQGEQSAVRGAWSLLSRAIGEQGSARDVYERSPEGSTRSDMAEALRTIEHVYDVRVRRGQMPASEADTSLPGAGRPALPEAAAAPREEVIQPRAGEPKPEPVTPVGPPRTVAGDVIDHPTIKRGDTRVIDGVEHTVVRVRNNGRENIVDAERPMTPAEKAASDAEGFQPRPEVVPMTEREWAPPAEPAPAAPELTLVGRTNKGVGVYQRPGYQPGDTLVTRTDSGRLGAAHPGEVAEARANAAKADKATSAANIDAAVEGIRGGKPARVPKTERGAQAGIGNPLEMAATAASLPRKAFGAIQQGEKAVMERVKTVLSRVAGDIPVGRGLTARDLIGIAKERLEPNVMGREMRNRIDEIGYERAAAKMDSGEAFKGLKVTDPATAERVTDYFEGRATQAEAQAALDPKSHKVLEWAANQRDVNQRELIDLGVLTQEMVDNLKGGGQYATRSYEAVLEGVAEQQGIVSNGKRIPKMWERKDLSPERRQQLGEIRDPRVVIATTLAKQGSLLPMARLFRDVAANPRQASLEGGEGWTREPLPNQPTRYGKLAGMYVRRPFKKWLDSVQGERTATDAVADVVNGWVADWKFGAVSGRPASLLRDVMGNELFGEFSNRSHADLTNLVDDAGAVRIMRSKPGTPEYDLLKRFVEKGVTDGSSFEPDTLKMLEEVTRAPGRNMPEKIKAYVKDKLSAVAHGQLNRAIPGTEVVARVRQLQDAFFRVRALHHDIRKGATVDEAIAQVRLDYPYFGGNVAGAVMRAKGLPMAALRAAGPIPPFLNFMEWGAKWAVRQAINRPATSAALVGGLSALSSAVAKMVGLSDEDRRRMEAAIPKYRRPSLLRPLVGVDDNGNPTVIDLSYVVPMGNELETAIATMKAMTGSSDEIDDDGMRGLPVGPAMALFAQIGMNKKMFSDTPINTSQDPAFGSRTSAPEGRRQMLRYIAEGMIPTVRDVGKFYRAVKGVPLDSKGKIQPDVLLTALDTFAGVKIRTSDVATDRYHSLLGATQIIQEKLRGWEKVQKDPRIDPADLPEREREFAADIMDIYLKTLPFRVKGARNVVEKIQSTMDAQSVVGDLRGETNAAREAANPGGK